MFVYSYSIFVVAQIECKESFRVTQQMCLTCYRLFVVLSTLSMLFLWLRLYTVSVYYCTRKPAAYYTIRTTLKIFVQVTSCLPILRRILSSGWW